MKRNFLAVGALVFLLRGGTPAHQAPPKSPAPLWGWADLHAHPASHLAFGADVSGNNGLFWGKPGLNLEASLGTLLSDLPACAPDKHGSFDADPARHETHKVMIGMIDNITGFAHEANGAASFANWPNARSLTHQQMHITAIRRAYDGGQRLMIASVTDNEFLSALWTKVGFNVGGNQVPLADPNFCYSSAKRQLAFIKSLAAANPTWMEIAYSAAEARRIIAANKLALILSLEQDALTPAQTLQLVREEGVRQVIPIHLINNAVGGCAVYTDAFNTANAFVNSTRQTGNWNEPGNDGFFRVRYDRRLSGRLGRPQTLGGGEVGGAIRPREVSDAVWATLNYDQPAEQGGHRNAQGLTPAGRQLLLDLAKQGVLIDIAHMGEASSAEALFFAVARKYPVMDSHTGLRAADETAVNERALLRQQAQLIAELGGVIGLGTEGTAGMAPFVTQPVIPTPKRALIRFTGQRSSCAWPVKALASNPVLSNLTVTIKTGGDDLRGGKNRVWARVDINGTIHEVDLSKGASWPNDSTRTVSFPLPPNTRANSIRSFGLRTDPNAKNGDFDSPDNWDVETLKVDASFSRTDTVGTWLEEYKEALALMKGRGMALGTDLNGFAPQVSFSAEAVNYPLRVAQSVGNRPAGYTPPSLGRSQLGGKSFDFQRDGIAHYGMLADFMQALSQKPDSQGTLTALFRSANDVVEMWEKCEAAGRAIR